MLSDPSEPKTLFYSLSADTLAIAEAPFAQLTSTPIQQEGE